MPKVLRNNNWNCTEDGGFETFVGLTCVSLHPSSVEHLRETLKMDTDKFTSFIDYIFQHLEWRPKFDIEVSCAGHHRTKVAGQYRFMIGNWHQITIRPPCWELPEENREIYTLMHNLSTLGHEMSHAWQYEMDKFIPAGVIDIHSRWMGKLWKKGESEWHNRPWEIEATRMSNEMLGSFMEIIRNLK